MQAYRKPHPIIQIHSDLCTDPGDFPFIYLVNSLWTWHHSDIKTE